MDVKNKRCLNCNSSVKYNYCNRCGQSTHTSRINKIHIAEELQYGLLHVNKGLIYTIKELIIRPGITIKNYISGKRIKYTKPFSFLIVLGIIYSMIFHFFHFFPMEEMNEQSLPVFDYIPIYAWYSGDYSLVLLFIIPFYAMTTYWFFPKEQYNYIEHLVLFSYLTGMKIFIFIFFFLVIYFTQSIRIYQIVQIISEIYLIWGLVLFFKSTSWVETIVKVIACIIFSLIILLLIIFFLYTVLKLNNT